MQFDPSCGKYHTVYSYGRDSRVLLGGVSGSALRVSRADSGREAAGETPGSYVYDLLVLHERSLIWKS